MLELGKYGGRGQALASQFNNITLNWSHSGTGTEAGAADDTHGGARRLGYLRLGACEGEQL